MSRSIRFSLLFWPYILAAFIVLMLPKVESLLFPVVQGFSVQSMTRTGDYLVISGHMRKDRPCKFVGVSATVIDAHGNEHEVALLFIDNPTSSTEQRPTGSQSWGPWRITIPVQPEAKFFNLSSTHQCHALWPTHTELARLPVLYP